MDFTILPIAMTRVAWGDYIKLVQDHFGFSPTRGLDKNGISPSDPQAYLATLDLSNHPLQQLSSYNDSWHHVHCSFFLKINKSQIGYLYASFHGLSIKFYDNEEDTLILMTGSMLGWFESIRMNCNGNKHHKVRLIYNEIYNYFKQSGFKNLWSGFKIKTLRDGTFVLKRN